MNQALEAAVVKGDGLTRAENGGYANREMALIFPIVFISHAREDEPLAAALPSLISRVFRAGATEPVLVKYVRQCPGRWY